jgi:pimeloyl-ACP methyl ester carboxylesterase
VHGTRDNSASFGDVTAHLGEFDVEAYDRRGWGAGEMFDVPVRSVDACADDLVEKLERGPAAVVVGHSWGGHVAVAAAIRRPDLVAAVAMWETVYAWAPFWPSGYREYMMQCARSVNAKPSKSAYQSAERRRYLDEVELICTAPYDLDQLNVPCLVGYGGASPVEMIAGSRGLADHLQCSAFMVTAAQHHAHTHDPGGFAHFVRRAFALL